MPAPVLNEYKKSFTIRRISTTLLGGPRIPPSYSNEDACADVNVKQYWAFVCIVSLATLILYGSPWIIAVIAIQVASDSNTSYGDEGVLLAFNQRAVTAAFIAGGKIEFVKFVTYSCSLLNLD
jgi:hypothetical protein